MGREIPFGEPVRDGHTHKRAVRADLPVGWTVDNDRHLNRDLGVTVDFFTGPEDDDALPWATAQLWPDAGGTLIADRLYAAVRSFAREGTPVRLRVVRNEALDLGLEVKWAHHEAPAWTDFPLTDDNLARSLSELVVGQPPEVARTVCLNTAPPSGWLRGLARDQPFYRHGETQLTVLLNERYLPPGVFSRVATFELPARAKLGPCLWAVATGLFDVGDTLYVLGPGEVRPGVRMLSFAKPLDGQTPRGKPLIVERANLEALAARVASP